MVKYLSKSCCLCTWPVIACEELPHGEQKKCGLPLKPIDWLPKDAVQRCSLHCSYPTLIAVCNGDEELTQRYSGEFKSAPISKFLDMYLGGGKCSQGMQVGVQAYVQCKHVLHAMQITVFAHQKHPAVCLFSS